VWLLLLLVIANAFPCSMNPFTLDIEVKISSETSVLTNATRHRLTEDGTLFSQSDENLKSYIPNYSL
jgi:hypothetical protein